jgi:thiol-disulfide isomerase/thioredoxin
MRARRAPLRSIAARTAAAAWVLSCFASAVLVNFWATWCPPCRKELPSLQVFSTRFAGQDLVIIGISDEEAGKVEPFVHRQGISYPILLDPGRVVNKAFAIDGIPKSFVYDRSGRLVATAIDMRTARQFLAMLEKAGLH